MISNCSFNDNMASRAGAAIAVEISRLEIYGSRFLKNYAILLGGAIKFYQFAEYSLSEMPGFVIMDCVFEENGVYDLENSGLLGSAVFIGGDLAEFVILQINGSVFRSNRANLGAGIYIEDI